MLMNATLWAMKKLAPQKIGFLGCDFDYEDTRGTHFYGKGQRIEDDEKGRPPVGVFLDRLSGIAVAAGIDLVNLSDNPRTLLPFPKGDWSHG